MPPRIRALMVAEKPAVAKGIASILGRNVTRHNTRAQYVSVLEFEHTINGQDCTIFLTSVCGHLMTYDFERRYKKWNSCAPETLFDAPLSHIVNTDRDNNNEKIKTVLQRYARRAQWLLIATDNDREGENIGFEIIEVCKEVNPRIEPKRMKFSAVTTQEINRSLRLLCEPDERVSQACVARQELDLRIGSLFTRFQTMRLRQLYPNSLEGKLISYGPCQFPTLGFVVDRYRARERFVPEDFWKLMVKHETPGEDGQPMVAEFNWNRTRVFDKQICQIFLDMCQQAGTARIDRVQRNNRTKRRPVGLTTTEMQKLASRVFKMAPARTLKVAEELYQRGYISYPRTETDQFEKSISLAPLIQQQTSSAQWGEFASRLLPPQGNPNPHNGRKTDEAHPPIHPTKSAPADLSAEQKKIYELVTRHFLACCSTDANGHETSVHIQLAGEEFKTSGLIIVDRGYLEVYPYDKWSGKVIPPYQEDQEFTPSSIEMIEGETQPPKLLTEADLLSLMAKNEIGTDATMAEHIDKIQQREYVELTPARELIPTTLGVALVNGYDAMSFEISVSKPDLRREMEANMKLIAQGQKTKEEVVASGVAKYRDVFNVVKAEVHKLDESLEEQLGPREGDANAAIHIPTAMPVRLCPRCKRGHQFLRRTKTDIFFIGCDDYPNCRSAVFMDQVTAIDVLNDKCATCGMHKVKLQAKPGVIPPHISTSSSYECCLNCHGQVLTFLNSRGHAEVGGGTSHRSQPRTATAATTSSTANVSSNSTSQQVASAANTNARRTTGAPDSRQHRTFDSHAGAGQTSNVMGAQDLRGEDDEEEDDAAFDDVDWNEVAAIESEMAHLDSGPSLNSGGRDASNFRHQRHDLSNSRHTMQQDQQDHDTSTGAEPDENTPLCFCDKPSMVFTAATAANAGRRFFKCAAPKGGAAGEPTSCSFFQWEDQMGPECGCGRPSVRNQCRQGANAGREFYACVKRDNQGCGFFEWTDGAGSSSVGQGRSSAAAAATDAPEGDDLVCNCGLAASLRTVNKEGANKGRQFYACSKHMSDSSRCDFFFWADDHSVEHEGGGGHTSSMTGFRSGNRFDGSAGGQFSTAPPASFRNGSYNRGSSAGSGSSFSRGGSSKWSSTGGTGGKSKKSMTCFKCNKKGHFANECPGNATSASGGRANGKSSASTSSRAAASNASTDGKKQRLCSVCRMPGHTKKNCPTLNR